MRSLFFVAHIIVFLVSAPAPLDAETTGELLNWCQATETLSGARDTSPGIAVDAGYCLGYVAGFRHGYDLMSFAVRMIPTPEVDEPDIEMTPGTREILLDALDASTERAACIPKAITVGQLRAVFVKWAEKHPEEWHQHMTDGLVKAWSEAFPCDVER